MMLYKHFYLISNDSLFQANFISLILSFIYGSNLIILASISSRAHKRRQLVRWQSYYYKMIRCEHGQKITKFCITQHCHHKEAAGCDYCIKKYHFHLTNTTLLSQTELEVIVKTLTSPSDSKYKSKTLQDLAGDYLRQLRQALSGWFEQAQAAINDRLTHPLLRKQGLLATYQRIRNRDYRKINAKELKVISEFARTTQTESFKRQQIQTYFSEVEWTASIIEAAENMGKELAKLPLLTAETIGPIQRSPKLNETFESILREKERFQSQMRSSEKETQFLRPESLKLEQVIKSSSLMKNRLTREFSGKEKSSTPNKEIVNDILVRKTLPPPEVTPRIGSIVPVTLAEPKSESQEKYGNETREEKARRLRRRRSSIDEGMVDMKFGQQQRQKQSKEVGLKKKMILETIFSGKESDKDKQKLEKDYASAKIQTQNTVQQVKQDERKEEINSSSGSKPRQLRGKSSQKLKDASNIPDNRSDASSNKDSDVNIFDNIFHKGGFNVAELINSLIPAPPLAKQHNENQIVTNKVVKIPIADKQHIDEIQSPIFKNKRKMDRQHQPTAGGGGFGISLNPVQNKQQELPLPAVKEELKQETQSFIPNTKGKSSKPAEEDVIVLESNQTNSLCLFSEAVKSSSEKAIELLKAALKYSPDNLSAAQYLSYLYLESGKSKECLEVCQSILLRIEDKAEEFEVTLHLHNNRAAALNMLGRYSESIVVLQKCLKFRRKHYFYKNLADAYFSLGIPEKAAMNYEKAIRLDPGYDQAFYNLAVTQFIQEEYTSAKLNIDHALKIDSTNETYKQLERQISKRMENIMMK